jgi:hypothetical protein
MGVFKAIGRKSKYIHLYIFIACFLVKETVCLLKWSFCTKKAGKRIRLFKKEYPKNYYYALCACQLMVAGG